MLDLAARRPCITKLIWAKLLKGLLYIFYVRLHLRVNHKGDETDYTAKGRDLVFHAALKTDSTRRILVGRLIIQRPRRESLSRHGFPPPQDRVANYLRGQMEVLKV